jgi:UDP-glucose 4-epimerase
MIKKAVIIGSNGYLGRNLAFFLKQKGVDLLCYDIQEYSICEGVEYQSIDITKYDQVSTIDTNVDAFFLLAGITGTEQGFVEYERYIDINEKGLLNVLTHFKENRSAARIIFPSSRLIYKGIKDTPLSEESEKDPKTIYAVNKLTCESLLKIYHDNFGINYTVFRICIPYGNLIPGEFSYGTIGFFMKNAQSGKNLLLFGDGELKRTFTHISDLCTLLLEVIGRSETSNQIYNIGGETLSLKEIAFLIAQRYGVQVENIVWPEFALKIESGDTIFDDNKINKVFKQNIYYRKFEKWLDE